MLCSTACARMLSLLKNPLNGQTPHSASVPTRNVQNVTGIFLRKPAHFPDVLLVMQRVDDGAGAQEEQRLEEGVRGQVIHRRRRAVQADGHDHVAELRERGVSEDAFDVVLLDGDERGQQQGGEPPTNPGDDFQRMERAGH